MAQLDRRHAAWQQEAYAVYAVNGKNRILVGEERTFLDAFNRAADFLDARDPHRDGIVPSLEIVERRDGSQAAIWHYSADEEPPSFNPIAHWGFLHWEGPHRRTA